MSDLREAIAREFRVAYYQTSVMYEVAVSDIIADKIAKVASDALLAVVTAHMTVTVTDEDAIEMWNALDRAHGVPENDAMKAALEAFVANKTKAETAP